MQVNYHTNAIQVQVNYNTNVIQVQVNYHTLLINSIQVQVNYHTNGIQVQANYHPLLINTIQLLSQQAEIKQCSTQVRTGIQGLGYVSFIGSMFYNIKLYHGHGDIDTSNNDLNLQFIAGNSLNTHMVPMIPKNLYIQVQSHHNCYFKKI